MTALDGPVRPLAPEPQPFDLCGPLPDGTTVLEASAGTGKTFTLAALTARYVAEGVAELPQVMLVTFGNAASRELRDRVRERLVSAEAGLRDPQAARRSDDAVVALLAGGPGDEVEQRRQRLARALAGFDGATIATTHSFCSQMLAGLGTAADADPGARFTESTDDLVREVVDDLYVRSFARPGAGRPTIPYAVLLELGRQAVRDRHARLEPQGAPGVAGQRREAAARVREEVERRKRRQGRVDYDDWLVLLRDALRDPTHGPRARDRVRSRYRVVLVDEFQDTDPVQWEVLQLAFSGAARLVLVGDPKQSVYAFRGGDVTTYLRAADTAGTRATLTRNWRSDVGLLQALEGLFRGAALGDPRIAVRPVDGAHPAPRLLRAGAPVRLRRVARRWPRRLLPTQEAREAVAADVAEDLVALLSGPARLQPSAVQDRPAPGLDRSVHAPDRQADLVGRARGGGASPQPRERPLQPADIAVLVRTNRQGVEVRDALARGGVPVVLTGGGSVFGTPGAQAWLVLLEALEQPHRAGRVRAAALTVFLGWTEVALDAAGDEASERLGPRLRRWADLLADRGVAALFEVVSAEEQLPARVLARPDGERVMTDLRHLAQALHAAAREESLGLTALAEWLRRRIASAATESADERTRRLESDAAAVQVMTVHVSKGLQFPVVYVPFAWDRWVPRDSDVLLFHDDAGERVLHVGGDAAPDAGQARDVHEREAAGEELRLLYVALTRAQCAVVAHWAPTHNTRTAPLHRLLFGDPAPGRVPVGEVAPPEDLAAEAALSALAAASGGRTSAEVVGRSTGVRWSPPSPAPPPLRARAFTRTLDSDWRRTSYSALTAAAHQAGPGSGTGQGGGAGPGSGTGLGGVAGGASEAGVAGEAGVASEPEATGTPDEPADGPAGEPDEVVPPESSPPSPLDGLPGGAAFGTLVHEVLEDLDPAALDERCRVAVARRLGVSVDPAALADGLRPVLHTPLGSHGVSLADVAAADRLAEISFELPLGGGDDARAPTGCAGLADVAALLRRHDLGVLAPYADLLDGLEPAVLRGFLTGSVDALLRVRRDGVPAYVVVDHKTNRLGPDPLTAWHYRPEAMAAEMLRAHYPLQALLYCVAVHRFLRWRQPGYDPHRHLAGVLYLFVRGMCGPDSPPGAGVFEWHPPAALVVELSDLLAGSR